MVVTTAGESLHYSRPLSRDSKSLRQRKGHFLLVLFEKNVSEINAVVLTDEPDGPGRELPGLGRDTQLRQFFTMGRKIPCEGP